MKMLTSSTPRSAQHAMKKRQTRQIALNDEADAVAMQRGVIVVKKKKREKSRIMPVKKKSKV